MEMQPIDITQIIAAIIMAGGAVYSARQQHKYKLEKEQPKPPPKVAPKITVWTTVMVVSLVLLVANLATIGWRYYDTGSVTGVKITSPHDGATVEISEMVRGSSQNIPEGDVIWVVVYPHIVGNYYPQNDPNDIQTNGDWASLVSIGIEEDIGRKFDILAVLLDEAGQDAFSDYLVQAEGKKTWPGLERLPEGTVICDRITVIRK